MSKKQKIEEALKRLNSSLRDVETERAYALGRVEHVLVQMAFDLEAAESGVLKLDGPGLLAQISQAMAALEDAK